MSGAHLTLQTFGFCLLGALFVGVAVGNIQVILRFLTRGRRASMIPIVGGLAETLAFLLRPELRGWAWLPFLLEPGTGPMLIGALLRRLLVPR